MLIFYDIFLLFYKWAMTLASVWSLKAKKWVHGRKNTIQEIELALSKVSDPIFWFHAASLGEFEQGRPLMEMIKKRKPEVKILLSFFSPSGYEVQKNTSCADWVFYLPLDDKQNSKRWIETIRPSMVFFIKYESWFYYLRYLKETDTPAYLISANFREEQNFFGPFGSLLRKMLDEYSGIFVQNQSSFEVLEKYKVKAHFSISGDTRFDRVLEVSQAEFQNEKIETFCKGKTVLVAGSTWLDDEKMISAALKKINSICLILAPHEIDEQHLEKIENTFTDTIRLSRIEDVNMLSSKRVLIVDGFGMLSKLYRYGSIAYVGGGFNKAGIHNILEAAVYGRPVLWGPNYERANEAIELIKKKGGISVGNEDLLNHWLVKLTENKTILEEMSAASKSYVMSQTGATDKIYRQTVDTSAD